ncbi:MAG TPA: cytochrome c-type biogenesis CcmF C-terminal domain-containing protein [Polyangiaceae bacterium]|nr:cytochrome c-type biogenesis CcmF C-terminal domain-containing protein [Polyangiaceae bacterium]
MTILLHLFGSTFPAFCTTLLLGAMVVASYTFAVALAAGKNGRPRTLQAARFGAYGTVALIGVAVLCLAYAFVTHDFRIRYVSHYSDRSMPLHYLLTALWGGQDGSLLWWLFLLSAYIGVCVRWLGHRYLELQPYVIATLMAVVLFFCVLMAFSANPFATSAGGARADGDGLNPALQNYWMVIHPPCLYTGFVGCSVPFAFGVAALATGRLDHEWIVASRKWTLFAWMFLGIGNTLGMLWAYESLGWGGYWGWDPVENAAFMPFLTASAYVHSVMIQERRGLLKVWNVFLIGLTFFLTIFGTFLTRSGMIASVHAFAQSSIGNYFVGFLLLVVSFATTLVLWRWPELRDLKPTPRLRWAALAAGWLVIGVCAPGLLSIWRLSLPVGWRVLSIALVAGAAVFVALEIVFRRMTAGMDLQTRRPKIESILSREFTFVLNNWVLCSLLLFILVATTFPLISEALTGEKVTVGPPFYKAWVQPLGLVLLALMGIGTLFGWKKTSPQALRRAFRAPLLAMGTGAALHFALGRALLGFPAVVWSDAIYPGALGSALRAFNAFMPVMGFSLCIFNAAVIAQEFVLLFRSRARTAAASLTPRILWWLGGLPGFVHTLVSLSPQSRRRYGGYIVHLGIVAMFVGFTGQSWNLDREASLYPGQSYSVGDYQLTYTGARMEVDDAKRMVFADLEVSKGEKHVAHLTPGKFIYKKQPDSPTTEVAISHGFRDDVYVIVGSINPGNKNLAAFQVHINPLVSWIWFGCVILIAGSIVSMWPQVELGESRVWAGARGVAATAASVLLGIMLGATPAAHAQTMPGTGTVHIENDTERAVFGSLRCMCGQCARDLLSTCTCETASEARDNIRAKLKAGEARDQIVAEYAAEFGDNALAVPPNRGALRAIWAVPMAGIGLGAFGVAWLVKRWREGTGSEEAPAPPRAEPRPASRDAYDARLDEELKDLDE